LTLSLAIVCEAPADREVGCGLADRVLIAEIDWIEPETLGAFRTWRGYSPNDPYLRWQSVSNLAKQRNIRVRARDFGEEELLHARSTREALLLLITADHPPDAIVLVRDSDAQAERRQGMEQARQLTQVPAIPVVIGIAHTKRECWILAGFDAENEAEEDLLRILRQRLGFDAISRAEELTAEHEGAHRCAKRAIAELLRSDRERETACWADTPLTILAERGANTGLAAYLAELREHLVPLFKPAHT
jgi:hypothetical protein